MTKEFQKFNYPTIFIILGATGDLSRKKLCPSIFDLFSKDKLPDNFGIIGFSRRTWKDADFSKYVSEILQDRDSDKKVDFLSRLKYVEGDFNNEESWQVLSEKISEYDRNIGLCSNKLFYIATPPDCYEKIFLALSRLKMSHSCGEKGGWTRILVEKPFGSNKKEANKLEKILSAKFEEKQIYRIDHYLAKETLQNILLFRFANSIFEPIWNDEYIEEIKIELFEKNGINDRGSFFDKVGALSDVGQNHILQMLAITTMDMPSVLQGEDIRKERSAILKKLDIVKNGIYIRGQYEDYKKEKGVDATSQTETYFFGEIKVKSKRWRKTLFKMENGKALDKNSVKIKIVFRPKAVCLPKSICNLLKNEIEIMIQPEEDIKIKFWSKKDGFENEFLPTEFHFKKEAYKGGKISPSAYEKLLFDAICGEEMVFPTTEEIKASWHFIDKVRKELLKKDLFLYKKGSQIENGQIINN